MVGPQRPLFVLFGSSIVQFSYNHEGWGSILSDLYARKACCQQYLRRFTEMVTKRKTTFWWDRRKKNLLRADIVLRGYAGWNSRRGLEVLEQVFPRDAAVQPSLVLVYFGGNDSMKPHPSGSGPHVPLDEYVENMKKIAIHLKSLSENTRVIFLSTPPVNEAQICETFGINYENLGRSNESCRKYSEACLKLCQELNVKAIDVWTAIQQQDDWLQVCFTDGIHLSSAGSKILVHEVLKVLKEADWEPSLYWRSLPAEFGQDSPYDFVGPDGSSLNTSDAVSPWQTEWDLE